MRATCTERTLEWRAINRSYAKSDLTIDVQRSGRNLVDLKTKVNPVRRGWRNPAWPSSCVAPAGMSTSQTFRTNGMATHTYTHRLGGRAVNIYFVHHAEVIMLRAQDGVLFPR